MWRGMVGSGYAGERSHQGMKMTYRGRDDKANFLNRKSSETPDHTFLSTVKTHYIHSGNRMRSAERMHLTRGERTSQILARLWGQQA
jgi:hypothetical protein